MTFDAASLTTYLNDAMDREHLPGMAVAVARNGEVLYEAGLGYRDVERRLPVTPDTVFGVASVTKSFACLAVMQLAGAGVLSPDDPVRRWIPETAPFLPESVTLAHLMSHTSGLPGLNSLYRARAGSIRRDPDWQRLGASDPFAADPISTVDELIALMAQRPIDPLALPGDLVNYSNEGYALLQLVIERASSLSFRQVLQERIFTPLGMARSALLTEELESLRPDVTELYAPIIREGRKKGYFHSPAWWDVGAIYSNGSVKSTVRDLLRYLEVYRTGGAAVAPAEGVARMMASSVRLPTGTHYGYGLAIAPGYHGMTLVGHGGSIKGVSSHVLVVPEAGITAVVLINVTGASADRLALAAVNAALGLPVDTPKHVFPAYEPAPGEVEPYVGRYTSEESGAVEVLQTLDSHLAVRAAGVTTLVRAYAPDRLASADGAVHIRLLRSEAGAIRGLFSGMRVYRREA
jgi:CubicO group peptidase (beta-lactamase class C family)